MHQIADTLPGSRPPRGRCGSRRRFRGRTPAAVLFLLAISVAPAVALDDKAIPSDTPDAPGLLLERMQQAFVAVVDRVSPAAVTIHAQTKPDERETGDESAPESWVNTGGGVIIRGDGTILTSQHVIDGAAVIHVLLHDGRRVRARAVAADPRADLAVIRIQAENLTVAEFGDAGGLRRGHLVLVLGNPLGLAIDGQVAVNQGIVSAIGRPLPDALGRRQDRYYGDMIQTTVRAGPGDSGGPLLDIHGRVVGIMTAAAGHGGGGESFGFAVPMNAHTKAIIERLMAGRRIDYGYLGLEVRELNRPKSNLSGAAVEQGVCVDSVLADGPAQRAGLRTGDIIVTVDGKDVQSPDHFVQLVGAVGPERLVELAFVRDSKRQAVGITLARRPATTQQDQPARSIPFRGAVLGEVRPDLRAAANVPDNALLVMMVNDGSPAARAGLTPGDVVVRVNGEMLGSDAAARLADLRGDALFGLANGGAVLVKAP
jgi:S1-C subfamily serine protease